MFDSYNQKYEKTVDANNYATILSAERHPTKTTEKYSFVPTKTVLDVLADYSWLPASISEARTRIDENRGYQKHIIRLRHADSKALNIGDEVPELVITNSHMGSASFEFSLGMFRKICMNGLMVFSGNIQSFRVQHRGFATSKVEQAINSIIGQVPMITERVQQFKAIELSAPERLAFAESAIEARYGEEAAPIGASQLLAPRRYDDTAPTLWNTFNVVQENTIKGGLRGKNAKGGRLHTRQVKSINEDVRINRALWALTEKMAELKTSAA